MKIIGIFFILTNASTMLLNGVSGFVLPTAPVSIGIGRSRSDPASPSTTTTSTQIFGIPKMFRWLTDQYPNINRRLSEGLTPNLQVDNFYLDMNGIIHPCTHGNAEGQIIVLDETAMFKKIFLYVDRYVPCYMWLRCVPHVSSNSHISSPRDLFLSPSYTFYNDYLLHVYIIVSTNSLVPPNVCTWLSTVSLPVPR